jgi:hypothetical protein
VLDQIGSSPKPQIDWNTDGPPAGSALVAVEAGVRVQDALARLPHRDPCGHCRARALTGTVLADPIVSSLAPAAGQPPNVRHAAARS